ncbi:hemopexin [Pyxicephalus adspersus]|uniref:hemopexin n=1 Tax=Pyxicephalus adspersus TaxID=30357 RepID=UPI003B5B2D9E
MMRVTITLCSLLCLLSLSTAYPILKGRHNDTGSNPFSPHDPSDNVTGMPDRCTGEGFGAIMLDDRGVMHYFRGDSVWMGFQGPTQRINETFQGLTGPIDAAFRNHNHEHPLEHQRVYLFKGSQVWSYFEGKPVSGYPRPISEAFPGIPDDLDAAVECHKGECRTDSVLFFKGEKVYVYSPKEDPAVKQKTWTNLGPCTAGVRWMEKYFCFNGINFTRFDPVTGERLSPRPLDTRDYFVRCPGRGHAHTVRQNATLMSIKNRCSNRSFEAFSSDDNSKIYAFRGGILPFFRKSLSCFSRCLLLYRLSVRPNFLSSPDNKIFLVDLNTRKQSGEARTIIHSEVDSAMCNVHGLYIFHGPSYYHYKDVKELLAATKAPAPGSIATYFMDC